MGTIDYLDVKADVARGKSFYLVDREKSDLKKLNPMQNFHCAFVQDCEKSPATWTLYFNGALVGKMPGSTDVMPPWREVQSGGGIKGKVTIHYFFLSFYRFNMENSCMMCGFMTLP